MKKTKSIIALLLAAAVFLMVLPVTAAEEDIICWDFESGDLSCMESAQDYYSAGSVSAAEGGADNSSYCLKISGAEVGNGATITGLKSETDYVLTFFARADNYVGAAYPNVGINNYDGSTYQAVDNLSSRWTEYSLIFRTGAGSTSVQFYTWTFKQGASASADLYVDNIVLREKTSSGEMSEFDRENLLGGGWDFEANDISMLGDPAGSVDDGDKYYASTGAVRITADDSGKSAYCLIVSGGEVGNGKRQGGLKPDTLYRLSFRARTDNISGAATPIIGVKEYGGTDEQVVAVTDNTWQDYECIFKTGPNDENTSVYFFTWIVRDSEGASADFYVDDVFLCETDESALHTDDTQETEPTAEADDPIPENAVVLGTFTENPRAKLVVPLLIVCGAELLLIAVLAAILISKQKKDKKSARKDGTEE